MLITLTVTFLILLTLYWYYVKPNNLPPGPSGVPILGYLPWLIYHSKQRIKMAEHLQSQYGDIVCVRVGFSYLVFLNNLDVIKDALAKHGDYFSGRGLKLFRQEITHGKGILTVEGPHQREHRRFILRSLRNMGFGKIGFEEPIMDSIHTMQSIIDQHIAETPKQPLNIRECLVEAVAHNISRIVLGVKFNKEQLSFMISRLEAISSVPPVIFLVNSFPFLLPFVKLKFFRQILGLEEFKNIRGPLEERVMTYVQEHKNTLDPDDLNDFIYTYLDENTRHQTTEDDAASWDDEQIKHAATELLAAGMGTTEATITWMFMLMASNQAWQTKVFNELKDVIGIERLPSTRDLPSLPLSEATVLEVLRWSILASTGIPRAVTEDCHFQGYFIPKGTAVFPNLYNTTRDPNLWKDPLNFNPAANFLSSDQSQVINRDQLIAFGLGRRSCIGESLARMEVILFTLAMLQRYRVSLSPKYGMAKVINGIFRIPDHRWIEFEMR